MSSYPVPSDAVPVSAGMIVAVPAELLASPLRNGRGLGEADRSALAPDAQLSDVITALAGDLALLPWSRRRHPASERACLDWRKAPGPAPLAVRLFPLNSVFTRSLPAMPWGAAGADKTASEQRLLDAAMKDFPHVFSRGQREHRQPASRKLVKPP